MGTQNFGFGSIRDLEEKRKISQIKVDDLKSLELRKRNGQFSTPIEIADEIMQYGLSLQDSNTIRFLEPAVGTGAFISALLRNSVSSCTLDKICGFEIDNDYYAEARNIWKSDIIELNNEDFTTSDYSNEKFNLLITNPPYVRHHYLDKDKKSQLKAKVKKEVNLDVSGLSGLYCYFLLLADKYLEDGAVCGWLLPSEFMDVNYGKVIKDYLLNKVQLIRIHRYNPNNCLFDDALVSSCVVWFKKVNTIENYDVEFSYGGPHDKPEVSRLISKSELSDCKKWTHITDDIEIKNDTQSEACIGDYFDIKRGLATGDNGFFILNEQQIKENNLDMSYFKPILPSPRNMRGDEVMSDEDGNPDISEPLYLLDCSLDEDEIIAKYPDLWKYLQCGLETTATKYLCRSRKKWYYQERREPTPFLCSYMGRGSKDRLPFRFILNHSKAIASNSYLLLYPKDNLKKKIQDNETSYSQIWNALKCIDVNDIEMEGRVYGGGLKKIEPKELSKVKCRELKKIVNQ